MIVLVAELSIVSGLDHARATRAATSRSSVPSACPQGAIMRVFLIVGALDRRDGDDGRLRRGSSSFCLEHRSDPALPVLADQDDLFRSRSISVELPAKPMLERQPPSWSWRLRSLRRSTRPGAQRDSIHRCAAARSLIAPSSRFSAARTSKVVWLERSDFHRDMRIASKMMRSRVHPILRAVVLAHARTHNHWWMWL